MLLNANEQYLYKYGEPPIETRHIHAPYFLVTSPNVRTALARRKKIEQDMLNTKYSDGWATPLSKIRRLGEILTRKSFQDTTIIVPSFKVYTQIPNDVPIVSTYLFTEYGFSTAEHDIPYIQRLLMDLANDGEWILNTNGEKKQLKVLCYDIETTRFEEGTKDAPIDIIGWASFNVEYKSWYNLEKEDFLFEFLDAPTDWTDKQYSPQQLYSKTRTDDIDILIKFIKIMMQYDIIAGHNVLKFDNMQIREKVHMISKNPSMMQSLSKDDQQIIWNFLRKLSRRNRMFSFGNVDEVAYVYPTTLDTYTATRRFYRFLPSYTLKDLAPFMGVVIKDRKYVPYYDMKVNDDTLKYNRHDVMEQLGITMQLIQQTLPLSFMAGMPIEELLAAGSTKMWDYMAMIRAIKNGRIIPATCQAARVSKSILTYVSDRSVNRQYIFDNVREQKKAGHKDAEEDEEEAEKFASTRTRYRRREMITATPDEAEEGDEPPELTSLEKIQPSWRELLKVAKYGPEMPDWVEYPDCIGTYRFPGGLTIKPDDPNIHSSYIPWWQMVVADVGAMYPTILLSENVCADTIRLARLDETPDEYIWLRHVSEDFLSRVHWRKRSDDEGYVDEGVMIGIKKINEEGCVAQAMHSIIKTIAQLKREMGEAKKTNSPDLPKLQERYKSLKATRNAGTHGIMTAPTVSCRQFNLWAGTKITTRGQQILYQVLTELKKNGVRITYGDSIGPDSEIVVKDRDIIRFVKIQNLYTNTSYEQNGKEYSDSNLQALTIDMNGRASFKPIKYVMRHRLNGSKKMYRVNITNTWYVDVTEDHSIIGYLNNNQLKTNKINDRLIEVTPMDIGKKVKSIVTLKTIPNQTKISTEDHPIELFEFIGLFIGDGSFDRKIGHKNYYIHLAGGLDVDEIVDKIIIPLKDKGYIKNYWLRDKGDMIINGKIVKIANEVLRSINGDKKIPNLACNINIAALLRGLFSADGSVVVRHSCAEIKLTSIRYDMIKEVSRMLWMLGISHSYFKENTPNVYHTDKKTYTANTFSHHINIKDTNKFREIIGFMLQRKNDRLNMSRSGAKKINISNSGFDISRVKSITEIQTPEYVYDLEVEDTHRYFANGILVHNTDGIYCACSSTIWTQPNMYKAYSLTKKDDKTFVGIIEPKVVKDIIDECNEHWRKILNYVGFELEIEEHGAMIFVKHKNYLIFDVKKGKISVQIKGASFHASDKPDLAMDILEEVLIKVLKDNIEWENEIDAKEHLILSIKKHVIETVDALDVTKVDRDKLIVVQTVKPYDTYKKKTDGESSIHGDRVRALERLLNKPIKTELRLHCIVLLDPLPGLERAPKSRVKPIAYMYPRDAITEQMWQRIDRQWYKDMLYFYFVGAFGLSDLSLSKNADLGDILPIFDTNEEVIGIGEEVNPIPQQKGDKKKKKGRKKVVTIFDALG
jgi:DNA polymerase elongation subunit (family B)/intein/homing endonuclease